MKLFEKVSAEPIERHSKVKSDLLVTENQCVVSLVCHSYHSYILIESIVNGGHSLEWYDFIPKEFDFRIFCMRFNAKSLMNREVNGRVRYCPGHLDGALTEKDLPEEQTKEELFKQYRWNTDSDSWVCSPEKVAAMKEDIHNDVERQKKGALKFKSCGHKVPNCTSWTWQKLAVAGIDARNKDWLNKVVIIGSHNIGSKRHTL